jgi:threonine synthase
MAPRWRSRMSRCSCSAIVRALPERASDKALTIVGATSGDTGSAAIHAVAGRENIEIFMLHPHGRVSDVQRRQMTTVLAPNVHNIAIEGSFDDAQAMVKRMFGDAEVTSAITLSAVNSINWARLMAQVVYYFWPRCNWAHRNARIAFSVPTGNFGDVFAGYVAARMGLPVERLIVATNVNDILHRALAKGDYSVGTVTPTAAPSMDIQVSSNFERLLFDLEGRDGSATGGAHEGIRIRWENRAEPTMRSKASLFKSARADADEMSGAMRWAYEKCAEVIDPHTAIALHAARNSGIAADMPVVTLATAHPAKFPDAVERATGLRPSLPARVGNLFDREESASIVLPSGHRYGSGVARPCALGHAARNGSVPEPVTLVSEPRPDYTLIDSGNGRKLEAYGAAASSAPNRRRCGNRRPPTGRPMANSSPDRTRMAAAAGIMTGRCRRWLAAQME